MITYDTLFSIVERMKKESGDFKSLITGVGLQWRDVEQLIINEFGAGAHGQMVVNFMMLGGAIGFLYAKGETIHESTAH